MSDLIYIYSTSKKQFFYISEKVRDIRTNIEGIIVKIYHPLNSINEVFIKVKYPNKKIVYNLNNHIHLEKIN